MKILVTGSSGFVGSFLCPFLKSEGHEVISPTRALIGNIDGNTDWSKWVQGTECVIHLAARVHVMEDTAADPLSLYRKVNVAATINLARQAAQAGVKRFIFLSSIKVNGEETKEKPFSASDLPAPQDPYGISKFEAEQGLREVEAATGMEVVIVRPPLIYGPGVKANFLKLISLVNKRVPLPFGSIDNRRSMVSLDNLTDLLMVCCSHPSAAGKTFLVSDDRDVSFTELLKLIANASGKKIFLLPVPSRLLAFLAKLLGKSSLANRLFSSLQVDIRETKNILSWKPKVPMEETLKKTISHWKAR